MDHIGTLGVLFHLHFVLTPLLEDCYFHNNNLQPQKQVNGKVRVRTKNSWLLMKYLLSFYHWIQANLLCCELSTRITPLSYLVKYSQTQQKEDKALQTRTLDTLTTESPGYSRVACKYMMFSKYLLTRQFSQRAENDKKVLKRESLVLLWIKFS